MLTQQAIEDREWDGLGAIRQLLPAAKSLGERFALLRQITRRVGT